ncbi:hypothetical membrane protein [Corynebacterium kutscheri]|uniref:Hypothetical membrane protein n=1 Tax=Corynebacterium kutscheri TaxID=35755 RepID=A0A0F6R177_9CORY|nr:hypothetical protein [Corynebacterium kutscheri]AKE40843.1 hypothetical protein UL82_03140 [Corynebacterium kutscheri]VEH06568.1 hypothetical membrane protein [Corynebacterium kutscheri]VEH09140.1 hypothetical membrane protein [Corynebacterium kutscheri]VEH82488.1 hypothetical membrane protein [Corynebacterium kutscheri]
MSAQHSNSNQTTNRTIRVRLWHIIFLVLIVAATFSLAWWQWTRFQSGTGTFQNLGYALQWPFFGAFFIYAYRKLLAYENEKRALAEENEELESTTFTASDVQRTDAIDESFLPNRPQISIEDYNALNTPKRGQHD